MSDKAGDAFYTAVSSPIRRLNEELKALASAYGFLDSSGSAARCTASNATHYRSRDSYICSKPAFLVRPTPSSSGNDMAASSDHLQKANARPSWRFGPRAMVTTCTAGGFLVLAYGFSFAQLPTTAVPALAVMAMAGCWLVSWGLLKLTVHLFAKKLRALLADLHFQHKISREIVRWVQELEVTFKALSLAPPKAQQIPATSVARISQGLCKDMSTSENIGPQPHTPASSSTLSCCGAYPCCNSVSEHPPRCTLCREEAPRERHIPGGSLRIRFCQVLEWQEDILCRIYEDIMRPKPGSHLTFWQFIFQGPWKRGERTSSVSSRESSVRALKEIAARSWTVHSRLSAGLQIALRQLLLSLDSHPQRRSVAFRPKRDCDGRRLQPPAAGLRIRRPIRALHNELMMLQKNHQTSCISHTLSDEVAQATLTTGGASFEASIRTNKCEPYRAHLSPSSHLCEQGKERETGSASLTASRLRRSASRRLIESMWGVSLFRSATLILFECFGVVGAALEGVAATWWLVIQLNRLAESVSAASRVAEETARALRVILEEDWASCPVFCPQPRWVPRLLKAEQDQSTSHSYPTEQYLHLLPCSVEPPTVAFQPFGIPGGTRAHAHIRITLASMSRHVAASLALLRLPVASCCCSCNRPLCSSGCGRDTKACRPDLLGTKDERANEDSGDLESPCTSAIASHTEHSEDTALYVSLELTLRHLRAACEEGEKLQQSLRPSGRAARVVRASPTQDAPPGEVQEEEEATDPLDEVPPQRAVSEASRCLEVYSAVGQDCTSNRLKCQEEAALLAAFSEEDPAMRERSQFILRELEARLLSHKVELQSVPCVFKELSAVVPSTTDRLCLDGDVSEGTVCISTTDMHASTNPRVSHSCTTEGECDGLQAVGELAVPRSRLQGEDEDNSAPPFSTGEADSQTREKRAMGFLQSLDSGEDFVSEANDAQLTSTCTEENRQWLDSEVFAFGLHQHKLRARPSEASWQSAEAAASRSLVSELNKVLTGQRLVCGAAQGPFDLGKQNAGPTVFEENVADEDEWDACDVAEGQSFDAKEPLLVAAPSSVGNTNSCTTDGKQHDATHYTQDSE